MYLRPADPQLRVVRQGALVRIQSGARRVRSRGMRGSVGRGGFELRARGGLALALSIAGLVAAPGCLTIGAAQHMVRPGAIFLLEVSAFGAPSPAVRWSGIYTDQGWFTSAGRRFEGELALPPGAVACRMEGRTAVGLRKLSLVGALEHPRLLDPVEFPLPDDAFESGCTVLLVPRSAVRGGERVVERLDLVDLDGHPLCSANLRERPWRDLRSWGWLLVAPLFDALRTAAVPLVVLI
jgi:hypothetical protein